MQSIMLIAEAGNVLVVHPSVPARSVKELIALAKKKPGSLAAAQPVGNKPEEFAAFIHSELEKWAKVIKAAGIKPQARK
jgi:tripartite-type tricarboxylate transporter receptor subunit TctC